MILLASVRVSISGSSIASRYVSKALSTHRATKFTKAEVFPKSASKSAFKYLGRSRFGTMVIKGYPVFMSIAFISNLAVLPLPSVNGCI